MQITQQLASGLIIRQDFRDSVRFVMFETGVVGWEYGTHGGTAFIVNYGGRFWGITCRHVLVDFKWKQLALTDSKFGRNIAELRLVYYPSEPIEAAEGSDILDIAVVEFSADADAAFFNDRAYIIDDNTISSANVGDQLQVNGLLKEKTQIGENQIAPVFALLDFADEGPSRFDPALRQASAKFLKPDFQSLTGLSGSPVFNRTARRLCGVVVRGTLNQDHGTIRYIEISDVLEILTAIVNGTMCTRYSKTIKHPV